MLQVLQNWSRKLVNIWRQRVGPRIAPLISTVWIGGLSIAALALWGFAEIADEVLEQETQAIDRSVLLVLQNLHSPLLNQIMIGITFLGDPLVLAFCIGCFGLFLLIRQKWIEAIALFVTTSGAIGLNILLKNVFARSRPTLWQHLVSVHDYSFPSGHAMVSLVIYGLIGYWLATRFREWRSLVSIVTISLISLIGLSRMYLGVHWPTDIAAGYAAGLVWLATCILALEVVHRYYPHRKLWQR